MAAAPPNIAIEVADAALTNGWAIAGLLAQVRAPVTAINTGWLGANVESLARHGIGTTVLADLGHFAMLEDPPRFNRVLAEVVDRLGSGR